MVANRCTGLVIFNLFYAYFTGWIYFQGQKCEKIFEKSHIIIEFALLWTILLLEIGFLFELQDYT